MIKEFEFYHGAALTKLVHFTESLKIRRFAGDGNASYVLNDGIGIYLKHSSKRMSPWHYSVQKIHSAEIKAMSLNLDQVFVLLVCGDDGVVTLSHQELQTLITGRNDMEWIRISRTKNKEYTVTGSNGSLSYKIGKKDFPRKIFGFEIP